LGDIGSKYTYINTRGGDLGGTGGQSPPKFEVRGMAHALVPPIFREVMFVGCVRKYEQSKKRSYQGILF